MAETRYVFLHNFGKPGFTNKDHLPQLKPNFEFTIGSKLHSLDERN